MAEQVIDGSVIVPVGRHRDYRALDSLVRFITAHCEDHTIKVLPSGGKGIRYRIAFTGMPQSMCNALESYISNG